MKTKVKKYAYLSPAGFLHAFEDRDFVVGVQDADGKSLRGSKIVETYLPFRGDGKPSDETWNDGNKVGEGGWENKGKAYNVQSLEDAKKLGKEWEELYESLI